RTTCSLSLHDALPIYPDAVELVLGDGPHAVEGHGDGGARPHQGEQLPPGGAGGEQHRHHHEDEHQHRPQVRLLVDQAGGDTHREDHEPDLRPGEVGPQLVPVLGREDRGDPQHADDLGHLGRLEVEQAQLDPALGAVALREEEHGDEEHDDPAVDVRDQRPILPVVDHRGHQVEDDAGGHEDHLPLHRERPRRPGRRVDHHQPEDGENDHGGEQDPVGAVSPPFRDGLPGGTCDGGHQSASSPSTIGVGSLPIRYCRMWRATGAATWPPLPPSSISTTTMYSGLERGATPTNQAWLSLFFVVWPVPVFPPTSSSPSPKCWNAARAVPWETTLPRSVRSDRRTAGSISTSRTTSGSCWYTTSP